MRQFYNIEDAAGHVHKVLVLRSIQHTPYERELTVTPSGFRKLSTAPQPLHCAPPTPYRPRAILFPSR